MKVRRGFISNSSSSSFILVTREPITEKFLRQEYGWLGPWAEALIRFLEDHGSNELKEPWNYQDRWGRQREPIDVWKEEHRVEPEAIVTEYLTSNWDEESNGRSDVARALYYTGCEHLKTKNIRVFLGSSQG